jgi:hypothetical protein
MRINYGRVALYSTLVNALLITAALGAEAGANTNANQAFDPHDFSGVWLTNHANTNGFRSFTKEENIPSRTAWGEARYATTMSGRTTDAHPVALAPAIGNDPIMQCNPEGYPRITFFGRPMEFFQVPDRMLMLFEWQRTFREVWMDGRKLPENADPKWLGHAVGRWEEDTLVIDSTGYDDRGWFDMYGNIYSDQMRMQERWRRTGPDTIEMTFRVDDPKAYKEPWISTTKVYRRQKEGEIFEEICAPMDEALFNDTVRDVAGTGNKETVSPADLDKFTKAVLSIRAIQERIGKSLEQMKDRNARTAAIRASYTEMVNEVQKNGLSLHEYQRIAQLTNSDPDIREVMMQRLAPKK